MAVSPDGGYAYIATRNADHDTIYTCLINNDTGYFEDCKNHYGQFLHGEYNASISTITLNRTGDKLYVLYKMSADNINRIKICSNEAPYHCQELGENFTEITSLAISSDNKFAYLISQKPDESSNFNASEVKFYACPIEEPENGMFKQPCHSQQLSLDVLNMVVTNKAVYFVMKPNKIQYCPFEESGARLGDCITNTLHNGYVNEDNVLSRAVFDKNDKIAYFYTRNSNYVYRCAIVGTGFQNCGTEVVYGRPIIHAQTAVYRRNKPNDHDPQVTFHWKP